MRIAGICNSSNNFNKVFYEKSREYLVQDGFDGRCHSRDEVIASPELFSDTEIVFSTWGMPVFTEEEIKRYFPKLTAVFYAAGSIQSFAKPFLNVGVKVFSAWAANAVPVAEYTVAQILLADKGFFKASKCNSIADRKERAESFKKYPGNYGARIGIIGAGMIGKLVIKELKRHDLEVLVFDPFLPDKTAEELGVEKTSLAELFSKCGVVSNHLANNSQTVGMLNRELFSAMPPFATFINTGRGAQVVEADLIAVLKARPDLTALLDVTMPEPPVDGSELYTLPNCILTPHIAGSSGNEVRRMADYMLAEYIKFSSGEKTDYEVNAAMLETMT